MHRTFGGDGFNWNNRVYWMYWPVRLYRRNRSDRPNWPVRSNWINWVIGVYRTYRNNR
jgi:hypothetical protein